MTINKKNEIKKTFESLFKKRELDDWYKESCKKPFEWLCEFTNKFSQYQMEVHDMGNHIMLYFTMKSYQDDQFDYEEKLIVEIAKIFPFYNLTTMCHAKYSKFEYQITGENISGTVEFDSLIDSVETLLEEKNYTKLKELELNEIIYEWDELNQEQIETFGFKKMTLEVALFFDVLNLIED